MTTIPDYTYNELLADSLERLVRSFRADIVCMDSVDTLCGGIRNVVTWIEENMPGTGHDAALTAALDAFDSVPLSVSAADSFCRIVLAVAYVVRP